MTSASASDRKPNGLWFGVGFGLLLAVFGGATGYVGMKAVHARRFEVQWKSTPTLVVMTRSDRGTVHYEGAEAVRMGVGLAAFGTMLALWGVVCAVAPMLSKNIVRFFVLPISLSCLVASIILLIPPWTIAELGVAATFYPSTLFWAIFSAKRTPFQDHYGRWALGAMVATAIGLSLLSPGLPAGLVLGFFAAIALGVHLGAFTARLPADTAAQAAS